MKAGTQFTVTNPQPVGCSYYWLPGITIPGKGSITLGYDPRERAAGVHRTQLMHDMRSGLVNIEQKPEVVLPPEIPPAGPAAECLREQAVRRDDDAGIRRPETINLNEKLGWKPFQTVVQTETPEENLEDARAKTIGANAMNTDTTFPFGMPPELVKAQALADRAAAAQAIADAAVKAHEEEAAKAAIADKPKRGRRGKAAKPADVQAQSA